MVIPKPVRIETRPDRFILDRHTALTADPAFSEVAAWSRSELGPVAGGELLPGPGPGAITLSRREMRPEAYRLSSGTEGVLIEAGDAAGAFYGVQTLRQLLPAAAFRKGAAGGGLSLPAVRIEDAPRFAWRGVLLDVARHFLAKADLLRFIDLVAMHKLNVLHLHLTDDQGWRLEIKRYPRLTEVGAWSKESQVGWNGAMDGRPHGGFAWSIARTTGRCPGNGGRACPDGRRTRSRGRPRSTSGRTTSGNPADVTRSRTPAVGGSSAVRRGGHGRRDGESAPW